MGGQGSTWTAFVPLVLMLFLMYFLLIRPQKKREKQVNDMRSGVKVGDEIITIGGICGKVVKTKDESLVIQVGADKLKFEVMRWAISKVVSSNEKASKKPVVEETESSEPAKKSLPKRMKKAEGAVVSEAAEVAEAAQEAVSDSLDPFEPVAETSEFVSEASEAVSEAYETVADTANETAEESYKRVFGDK